MIEVTFEQMEANQKNFVWFVGCKKEEANYVWKAEIPEANLYARELTADEKETFDIIGKLDI